VPRDPLADDPRVALAEERTLLAWVRTGLAMMGFGFVVARFGVFLRELAVERGASTAHVSGVSVWIGAALVIVGVAVELAAAGQHVRRMRALDDGRVPRPSPWLPVAVCTVLAVVGIGMAAYLLALWQRS